MVTTNKHSEPCAPTLPEERGPAAEVTSPRTASRSDAEVTSPRTASRSDRGATAVEYAILLSAITAAVVVAVTQLGVQVAGLFSKLHW